jgi:hypothetical protein
MIIKLFFQVFIRVLIYFSEQFFNRIVDKVKFSKAFILNDLYKIFKYF